MSGEDEIIPYAFDNFDPDQFETFDEFFKAVSLDFELNGRLPLEEILDSYGIDAMKDLYDRSSTETLTSEKIQTTIDQFRRDA